MEIVIGIIILAIIIFVVGGIDNDRPVSKWSDEKLARMRDKLQRAASLNFDAGNMNAYKKHADKKKEVDDEVVKRERAYHKKQASEFKSHSILPEDMVVIDKAMQAANSGDAEAQALVGTAYLSGANGLPQDLTKAGKYLLMAAAQGNAYSSFVVAGLYIEGMGLPQDRDKARAWAFKAKNLGYPDADAMIKAIDAK
ncbi:MAG: tetratricopeptide repeat protein [Leptothrix ochracea]|uniref:tetratricopeptide repeat protein n=1 Tax=Leptothrix ochracea TaxID=735331 RepID=UPI0034E21CF5